MERIMRWLPSKCVRQAIEHAWFADLASLGINFTGGEVFHPNSNLLELVEIARSFGLQVRINTSGWWGRANNIRVGNRLFEDTGSVVAWLREQGVAALALSCDARFERKPWLWHSVVSIIRECERTGQDYHLIFSGVQVTQMATWQARLAADVGVPLRHLEHGVMEMIDMGGGAQPSEGPLSPATLLRLVSDTPCQGRGFTRPIVLHVAPHGGVRTCMYAPGAAYAGNLGVESLLEIVNHWHEKPVHGLFADGNLADFVERFVAPHATRYHSIAHPCTAAALVARIAEGVSAHRRKHDCPSNENDLCGLHEVVSRDLNLCFATAQCEDHPDARRT